MVIIKSGKIFQEIYKCIKCGTPRTINRLAKSKRKMWHPKHMMCPICNDLKAKFIRIE